MNQTWKESWKQTKEKFSGYWNGISRNQKFLIIGTFVFILLSLSIFTFVASRPQYIPLYTSELTQREIGDIKAALDAKGFADYKLSDTGTTIMVPKKDAPELLVHLASQGLPKNGQISYEVFSQNMTFGATDRQLDVIERDAMQNELSQLIKRIAGIKSAEVMITLPQESVFIRPDDNEQATASIVVDVEPGQHLSQQQIRALYYLVSRSVPKLPIENIVIMDQYSELLELKDEDQNGMNLDAYEQQRKIKQDVEKDIQQQLQQLLGTVMGQDKVIVHTFVSLNFDKVKTQENLVQPVDQENNEGIAISVEKVSKTFNGEGAAPGGIVGNGQTDVPGYPGTAAGGNSEYEELQNRVNYEVNRISRDITQSPYKIEDLTINVGVEPPDPNQPNSLTPETQQNIKNIIGNVVRTALGNRPDLAEEDINNRISIFPRAFTGREPAAQPTEQNPYLLYLAAGAGVLLLGGILFAWMRRRRAKQREEVELLLYEEPSFPEPETMEKREPEESSVRKHLEEMAKQRPEEFVQLLRSWMTEERE